MRTYTLKIEYVRYVSSSLGQYVSDIIFVQTIYVLYTVAEDERHRLVEVLEPAALCRQRCRRAAGDRLEHGHV